jgi:hypothetical protein
VLARVRRRRFWAKITPPVRAARSSRSAGSPAPTERGTARSSTASGGPADTSSTRKDS